jgi:hypothetical protein
LTSENNPKFKNDKKTIKQEVKCMGKLLKSGTIVIDGEKIAYEYRKGERLPNSTKWNNYVTANYETPISIDDHGDGLEIVLNLLRNEITIRKQNQ